MTRFNCIFGSVLGNMPRCFLRSGVHREAVVSGMPVQVHGMLREAAVRPETNLYHR